MSNTNQAQKAPLWRLLNEQRTKTKWEFKISTPKQEREKWGGNCGAQARLFTYDGSKIMGRPNSKTIAFWPHWREENETAEHSANLEYTALAVNNLASLAEALEDAMGEQYLTLSTYKKIKEALNRIS